MKLGSLTAIKFQKTHSLLTLREMWLNQINVVKWTRRLAWWLDN